MADVRKFYTIAGIQDDEFPPDHPSTIKFYDAESAQGLLDLFIRLGCENLVQCSVAEHEA